MSEGLTPGADYTGITIVFACHDGEGNYLFARRTDQCRDEHWRWDPGAGHLEFGEHVDDAITREISQEYATVAVGREFLGYRDVHRFHFARKTHWIALDFRVRVDRALARIGEPHKFDRIGWFRLDELPHPMHSQYGTFLDQYRDKL